MTKKKDEGLSECSRAGVCASLGKDCDEQGAVSRSFGCFEAADMGKAGISECERSQTCLHVAGTCSQAGAETADFGDLVSEVIMTAEDLQRSLPYQTEKSVDNVNAMVQEGAQGEAGASQEGEGGKTQDVVTGREKETAPQGVFDASDDKWPPNTHEGAVEP